MAQTDNVLNDLIINNISQAEYDSLVATGQVQEDQIYATDGDGVGGGISSIAHDETLSGDGTADSPLGVKLDIIPDVSGFVTQATVETMIDDAIANTVGDISSVLDAINGEAV